MEIKSKFPAWKKKKRKFQIDKDGKKIKPNPGAQISKILQNGKVNGNSRQTGGQEQKFQNLEALKKKTMLLKKKKKQMNNFQKEEELLSSTFRITNGILKKEKKIEVTTISTQTPKKLPKTPISTPSNSKNATPMSTRKHSSSQQSPPHFEANYEKFSRPQLPIDAVEQQLMYELASQETLIVIGETGSGKSTQVPQLCVRAGIANSGSIAVTQPRRVAAISLASRVATEMGTNIGGIVGYHVRFENATCHKTKIEYMTDGIVLRKALVSPLLDKYSCVIIDEAHERSLHSDVLMCILRQCQDQRRETNNPLRLIIMSATLQAEKFQSYFNNAKVVLVAGRTFPIEVFHVNPKINKSFSSTDYVYNAVICVKYVHLTEPKGRDILVFLTGSEEIEAVASQLAELNGSLPASADVLMPVPLYAALRPEKQKEAFRKTPQGARKVIISTNIAETSVTIPGIRVVIDSGKVKTKRFEAFNRIDVLKVHNVSKAQAKQRAGRAGRDAPGKCYRLYSREDFHKFEAENMPEILRCNLSATFLELMKLGMKNPHRLKLIDPPETDNINAALLELTSLGAIRPVNSDRSKFALTEMGDAFCMYPLPPDHARILFQAQKEGCIMEAIKIVAAMQTDALFSGAGDSKSDADVDRIRRRFETREGDHITLLKLVLVTNQFFDQLNKKTESDARYGKANKSLEREYNQTIRKFCNDNMINEQHLKTASMIEEQLKQIAIEQKVTFSTCGADFMKMRKALALGMFLNSCEYDRQEDRYRLMINPAITLKIHPSSCLSRSKPAYIVFSELMKTNDLFALQVTLIDGDWVRPLISDHKKMRANHLAETTERVQQITRLEPKAKKAKLNVTF
ncbi:RNA helicase [Caenorhabditis elegans]|uniref:RNA helicase n=1 Tax=Caenorhabditis elegans TaxID=6239 RepID=O01598_CAEEL|nr:RNA helicase [Caenorhabditis elegans]CCD63908.1 RNA helicase [Caenorhabditis elegans]|eukprot:NP_491604.3 Uncharacterized protein CELE_T05E8.3 [Caenorhabditis elegans]